MSMEQPTLRTVISSTRKPKHLSFSLFEAHDCVTTISESVVDNDWCVAVLK